MCAIRKPSRKFLEDPEGNDFLLKFNSYPNTISFKAYLSVNVNQVPVNEQKPKLKWQFPHTDGDKRLMDVF